MISIIIQANGDKTAYDIRFDKNVTLTEVANANLRLDKIKDKLKSLEFKSDIKYKSNDQ